MAQLTIQQAADLAVEHQQAGRLAQAEVLYRQILASEPNHAATLHQLGILAHHVGRNDVAIEMIARAAAAAPSVAEYHGNLGVILGSVGRTQEAIAAFRKAMALNAENPAVIANLASALQTAGELEEAVAMRRRVVALLPDSAGAYDDLGNALWVGNRGDEAITAYRQAVALNPAHVSAHCHLANALQAAGKVDEAISCFRAALAAQPENAEIHNSLGSILRGQGRLHEAAAAFGETLSRRPDYAEAHNNLGNTLRDQERMDEAIACYKRALSLKPNYASAHNNLGTALKARGEIDQAIACYEKALALQGDFPEALSNLGNALQEKGQPDAAIVCHQRALALKPDYAEAHYNLGNAWKDKDNWDEALACYQRALQLNPDLPEALSNMGTALQAVGQVSEAIECYRRALASKAGFVEAHSALLLSMHYDPSYDPQRLYEEHRSWNQRHAEPLKKHIRPHANDRDPQRRLKIGYVSPDLRDHVVARFVLPLLRHHDHTHFEIYCYAQVPRPDAITVRLRSHADQWRSLVGLSDQQAADLIRQDGIDILVDLAGHTANSRLLVFARKPAPVQVSYLGYPDTTGMDTIDYRLTDGLADPPGLTDGRCSERLVRLPQTAWCFEPPPQSPAVSQPPSVAKGYLTFGTFNNFAKLSEATLHLWGRILRRVPESRLLLKGTAMTSVQVISRLRRFFAAQGIAEERLELVVWEPTSMQHLRWYERLDVALDPFPYHGTTTTCEALWMGVPVVTLAGETHVSRVGASLLSSVGLGELVALSEEQYVKIAVELMQDQARLTRLRATLRARMQDSPLMNVPSFARGVEDAYRGMWRKWCSTV